MTQPHADRSHAKLAPSSAHRWMACAGSVRLSEGIAETPSIFAAEGTAAHELAERCLSSQLDAAHFKDWIIAPGLLCKQDVGGPPDGKTCWRVGAEMVDAVQTYLDVVREIIGEADEYEIEQRMDMSALVPGVFGTGDAIAYAEKHPVSGKRRVTIADLKFGKGVAVDAADNVQMLTYAVGVTQRYHNRGVDEVELVIVQPRAPHRDGPVRRWVTDVNTLYEHVMAMQTAAVAAQNPNAPFVTGDHCKFCKAAGICSALRTRVMEITMQDPATTPFRDWKIEEGELALVKGWAKRREEFAHTEALRKPEFAASIGAKLVGKRPSRKFKDENDAVQTLQLLGVPDDDIFESSVRSPAALEKLLPKKDRAIINTLAIKASSGSVLAPLDDPRHAIDPNDASGFEAQEVV